MKEKFLFPHRFRNISGLIFLLSLLLLTVFVINGDLFSKINPEVPVFAIAGNGQPVYGEYSETIILQTHWFELIYNEILDEILFILLIISGIVYAFSKEKIEDEMIRQIRLESLAWATYFNYFILLACYLLFYGLPFLYVLMIAMFSNLLFFIIRFRWSVYKYNKEFDEEQIKN